MSGYKKANPMDKPNEEDFRPMGNTETCSYPSCRKRIIRLGEAFVMWDSVPYPCHEIERHLPPMAKLDAVANPNKYVKQYNQYVLVMYLHPECAAEWGMHLIENALQADSNVGRTLRRTKDAVRKQTPPI